MHKLYELKEKLCKELESYAGEKISPQNLKEIDTLAHSIKNIDKIIASKDEEEYSNRRSMRSERGSYADGNSYRDSYRSAEYSRKRDAMGRYSKDDEMMAELRKLHGMANDEMQRESIERIMDICESK